MPIVERIRNYRHRAKELRAIAQGCPSAETQGRLKNLARDYERMAENLEWNYSARGVRHDGPPR